MEAAVLVIMGALVLVGLGIYLWSKQEQQIQLKLGELAKVIQGTQAKRSITGTWRGVTVQAEIQSVSSGENSMQYFWQTALAVPMGATFTLGAFATGFLGLGKGEVRLQCLDNGYKTALLEAGLVEMAGTHPLLSQVGVTVSHEKGWLSLRQPLKDRNVLPDPASLQATLELMLKIAAYDPRAVANPAN